MFENLKKKQHYFFTCLLEIKLTRGIFADFNKISQEP
jgi:hypothetical protein